jgi:glucosamine-phosphate N-acetyltransferase
VVGHIEDVVTRRGYEGKGIGRALVKKCIEICRIRGCYKVILNCSDKNVNFYRHLGFKTYDNGMRYDLK